MKPLLIRASAGTGKTYRLSLEFINLLMKYRIDFEEILVITFTRKATAEIRERIFEHLHNIVHNTDKGKEIIRSLQKDINPDLKFDSGDIKFLKATYKNMLTNKSEVNISTIDSFINAVFSGVIAPYHNFVDFKLDNNINDEYLPEIFEHILKDEKLEYYKNIFLNAKQRNLESFDQFIKDIINYRWLFEFIDRSKYSGIYFKEVTQSSFNKYTIQLKQFLLSMQDAIASYLETKQADMQQLLQKDYFETLAKITDINSININEITDEFFKILSEPEFIHENFDLLLNDKKIWNGTRIRKLELKSEFEEVQHHLANYLYYEKALIEELNIISLAGEILEVYDEIKFRDRIFTHSDISYYTFKFLYDKDLSIIENNNVLNIFYEQLSYNTRFILIDEFQDTSILQWSIFQPLITETLSGSGQKEYGGLIVVGDEKQAIYGWRGGERKLLTDFPQLLGIETHHDSLTISYRSKPILLNWINRLFGSEHLIFDEKWEYSEIKSAKEKDGFVQVQFRNLAELDGIQKKQDLNQVYAEFVNETLIPLIKDQKINQSDTAILMRKNKELEEMATVFDEKDIDYTLESSGSLFEHKAIKPILYILRFLVYEDPIQLVKILRSDLVLMHPKKMKDILHLYKTANDIDTFFQLTSNDHFLSVLQNIRNNKISILNTIKTILEEFNIAKLFSTEIELKNIHRFLEVAIEFENNDQKHKTDLTGFLSYCRSLEEKDEYSQLGQTVSNSIKLLTIHKSKGLQFETVFSFMNIPRNPGQHNLGLKLYYDFEDDFHSLQDHALTYNFDKIIKKCDKRELIDIVDKRNNSEEVNNIYVALTRAKNNLFFFITYDKKGDLEKFVSGIKDDSSVSKNIAKVVYNEFLDDIQHLSQIHQIIEYGTLTIDEPETEIVSSKNAASFTQHLKFLSWEDLAERKPENIHQLKTEIIDNQSIQIGNIVHEYLSYIDYDNPMIKQTAFEKTLAKYGSLFHKNKIQKIIVKVNEFIKVNSDLFNKDNWDKVFNEYTIFDGYGKESRIDRLMVNSKNKEILIIDYKTGAHYEEEQLDKYKEIIEKLAVVKKDKYSVKTKFMKVRI
jgi:ATP-dependent exoDNAse (exonuclease V) beta subunit